MMVDIKVNSSARFGAAVEVDELEEVEFEEVEEGRAVMPVDDEEEEAFKFESNSISTNPFFPASREAVKPMYKANVQTKGRRIDLKILHMTGHSNSLLHFKQV